MTGMEHAIERAVEVIWECGPWTDQESLRIARALAEAGWLAPAPLTEIRAENQFGETHRRWATDWKHYDHAEGDGRAEG